MSPLDGLKVVLLESRMPVELASLVERRGGLAECVPALREADVGDLKAVGRFIDALGSSDPRLVVFLSGAGVQALLRAAACLGRRTETVMQLGQRALLARGPKPAAALRLEGLNPSVAVREPYTTLEVIQALGGLDLKGQAVAIVHHGEREAALSNYLVSRGARLHEIVAYEWRLPEDLRPLAGLVRRILAGEVDALAFTSQVQARHLFQIAGEAGLASVLVDALNNRVIVAAVGPTCARALRSFGVNPHVVPEHPKMGHMVLALERYLMQRTVPVAAPLAAATPVGA